MSGKSHLNTFKNAISVACSVNTIQQWENQDRIQLLEGFCTDLDDYSFGLLHYLARYSSDVQLNMPLETIDPEVRCSSVVNAQLLINLYLFSSFIALNDILVVWVSTQPALGARPELGLVVGRGLFLVLFCLSSLKLLEDTGEVQINCGSGVTSFYWLFFNGILLKKFFIGGCDFGLLVGELAYRQGECWPL